MNALVYDIDQGIHKGKVKVALNEKRKKPRGFSFSINIANFEAFLSVFKLTKNPLFLKSGWVYISRCIYLLYPRSFSPRDKFFSQFQIQVNFKIWLMWICKYAQNVGKYGLNFKCGLKLQGYTVSLLVSVIRKENVIFRWLNSICKWFSRWWLLPKRKRQKLDVFASRHEKSLKNIPWILNGKMSLSSRSRTS